MKLPFFKKQQKEKDFFLALSFKPDEIGCILFKGIEDKLSILATKEHKITSDINDLSEEELIDACDLVITFVENSLPKDAFVQKTIFAVPYNWIEETKIKKIYLIRLKKLCEELELKPIGFIPSIEAIVHFLQKKEGAPIAGIFISIAKNWVDLYIARAGNIIEVKTKHRQENLPSTVEKILKEIETLDILPSRIILLNYENIDNIQQEFLSFPWTKNLPFLHLPQVMVLEKGFEDEAVINGVAGQMGFDILEEKIEHREKASEDNVLENTPLKEDLSFRQNKESEKKEVEVVGEDALGSLEEDIEETEDGQITTYDNFGFVKEKDYLGKDVDLIQEETKIEENLEDLKNTQTRPLQTFKNELTDKNVKLPNLKRNIFSISQKIKIPSFKIPNNLKLKPVILVIPLLILFCIFSIYVYYNFLLSSNVVIFLNQKNLNKDTNINLSTQSETDIEKSLLKINPIEIEVEGSSGKEVTGKKETGERAKGEIIIYNKTEEKKTFAKGTVLVSANNLQFTLSNEAIVASTSPFSTTLSTVKTAIEAAKFGSEYNLPSSTNFSFKDHPTSSYFAKNDTAFSGGTKKDITVVSKNDLDALAKEVLAQLEEKVPDQIRGKLNKDEIVLPIMLSSEFVQKQYDKKEGEEGQHLNLTAKVKFQGASYNKLEIEKLVDKIVGGDIPSNFYLDQENSDLKIENVTLNKDKTWSAKLVIHALYIPKIDVSTIKKDIKGKDSSEFTKVMQNIKGISDYKIIYQNRISFLPEYLPFNLNNINIQIKQNLP